MVIVVLSSGILVKSGILVTVVLVVDCTSWASGGKQKSVFVLLFVSMELDGMVIANYPEMTAHQT